MKTKFQKLKKQVDTACSRLKQAITELPNAEDGVTMLSKNCFTVSLSTIAKNGGNLSPGYYLSIETKECLIAAIESRKNPESIINFINETLSTSQFTHKGNRITISPKVAASLKQVWEQS
jgi:hypothetical protein